MNPTVEEILDKAREAYNELNAGQWSGTVWALLVDEDRDTILVLCQPPIDDESPDILRQHFAGGARFIALQVVPFSEPSFILLRDLTIDDAAVIASQMKFPAYMVPRSED